MSDAPREHLIVIEDSSQYAPALRAIREHGQVTQELAPRLALVRVPTDGSAVRLPPGATLYAADVPQAVLAGLTASERLFVEAWRSRTTQRRRADRPGEGLDWDAPGFTPPDKPHH